MTWQIFTTMNQAYYEAIGHEMIQSWLHHWPKDQCLTVYVEGTVDLPPDSRLVTRDWHAACQPWFDRFCETRGGSEIKFAKKGLVWCDWLFDHSADKLLWLDADVLSLKPMTMTMLDHYLGEHLGAVFDNSPSTDLLTVESGVVMLNPRHKKYHSFRGQYRAYYHTVKMPEKATRFYDGEVLGNSILPFGDHVKIMNADLGKAYGNPLKRVPLGQYLRHFKGRSKHHHDNLAQHWRDGADLNYNPLLVGAESRQND